MKTLFVHNIRMKEDNEKNLYTHSSYNEKVWKRYLGLTKELSVISRYESKKYDKKYATKHFQKFNTKKINNISISNITESIFSYINPKLRYNNNKIIENSVLSHDYIIARLPCDSGYLAIKYAKKHNKKYLIEVVACTWDSLWNHSFKGKIMAPIDFLKLKKYVKDAPYVIYVTDEFLQKRYPTNGQNVNCSNVVLSLYDDNVLNKRIERIKSKKNKIIIGTTAAVDVKFKGQQYIIEALGELKKQGIENYEYQLVGNGDQRFLKKIADKFNVTDQIKFIGSLPHDEVFKWLDKIDIYAQPSRQEGLPRSVIEAMSRGLTVIGAKTGGIPELIEDEFIFSNKKSNIKEICDILKGFRIETMICQAKRNYNESKKYDEVLIDNRRNSFFDKFKKSK